MMRSKTDGRHCVELSQGHAIRRQTEMQCLLSQLDRLGGVCTTAVRRAARMALWEYTPGT